MKTKTLAVTDYILVDFEPAKVFEYFTSNELLSKWWPKHCEIEPFEGGTLHLKWFNNSDMTCRFLVFRPNEELSFSFLHEEIKVIFAKNGRFTKVLIEHSKIPAENINEIIHIAQNWSFLLCNLYSVMTFDIDLRPLKQ